VVINNAADAVTVRTSCQTVGNLTLGINVSESINLDGLRVIQGSFKNNVCFLNQPCIFPAPFSLSSTTLEMITGDFLLTGINGLRDILFPKLVKINGSIDFERMNDLVTLDITKLSSVESFQLTAPNLTSLRHEGLTEAPYGVNIFAAGLESLDSFYQNAIPVQRSYALITVDRVPNLKKLTVGWPIVHDISIRQPIILTLGGPNTTSMSIDLIEMAGGASGLERGANIRNLTVGSFSASGTRFNHLKVSFDRLSNFSLVLDDTVQTMELSPEAVNWEDLGLHISNCRNLKLSSQFTQNDRGGQTQIWYWPHKDMKVIDISADLGTDFL